MSNAMNLLKSKTQGKVSIPPVKNTPPKVTATKENPEKPEKPKLVIAEGISITEQVKGYLKQYGGHLNLSQFKSELRKATLANPSDPNSSPYFTDSGTRRTITHKNGRVQETPIYIPTQELVSFLQGKGFVVDIAEGNGKTGIIVRVGLKGYSFPEVTRGNSSPKNFIP